MKQTLLGIGLFILTTLSSFSQTGSVKGTASDGTTGIPFASVTISDTIKTRTTQDGSFIFNNVPAGNHKIEISYMGFQTAKRTIEVVSGETATVNMTLTESVTTKEEVEVTITGTMKEVLRSESPVSVEVYTPKFFKKNPTPSIFDALQNVNGVRPQLNCSVCNTGDIHINGLEGPYTMILIDGMPIVSSLSTVYGLSGIPNSIIERVEIVKGPASSLYGSEAVGGLINIITKSPEKAPVFSVDVFGTSWAEINADLGFKTKVGKKATSLTGVNYYEYSNIIDNNNDNFTDVTLQERISVFQKWNVQRKENRALSFATRYFFEDRWGGELNWTPEYRGGDSIYGESILTKRWEIIGNYQLPIKERVMLQVSYNTHDQNSVYGDMFYLANQKVSYGQLVWDKEKGKHDLLGGLALRYTYYDDNTPATQSSDTINPQNKADVTWLPGIFFQDQISIAKKQKLLLGARYDYNSNHGNIFTPRLAYKLSINDLNTIRLNAGTGYRVVNLFTEDHAALTGARDIIIKNNLKPEQSYNVNLNYLKKIYPSKKSFIGIDASAWYTYFSNQIIPDYDTNPDQIIYDNLSGYSQSKGISMNIDMVLGRKLKILTGGTIMDVSFTEDGTKERPMLTEQWTGIWAVTYTMPKLNLSIDYTGNIYGPMRLPLLGDSDPRSEYSDTWSLQNIQLTYGKQDKSWKIFGGVKNILNWTPNKGNPFIIARAHDPFDKNVQTDAGGNVIANAENPYGLTFDPGYVFGPNQGMRVFFGIRAVID